MNTEKRTSIQSARKIVGKMITKPKTPEQMMDRTIVFFERKLGSLLLVVWQRVA